MIIADHEFDQIAALALKMFGLQLDSSKINMVSRRLSARVRASGHNDFVGYTEFLMKNQAEQRQLLTALTTNTTHFFREEHHFKTMTDDALPALKKRAASGKPVRIWSAACSRGQEPYSIAMSLMEAWPEMTTQDARILATDIDPDVLSKASKGIYTADELADISTARLRSFFDQPDKTGTAKVRREVRELISFGQLNLPANWPFKGMFDIIFCRNVAIYFPPEIQAKLWQRLAAQLHPGGYLFIGHSERIAPKSLGTLEPMGKTTYRKGTQ